MADHTKVRHDLDGTGPLRLVGYLRVSTDRQAEHGLGLDVQEQAIRAWCRQHGHRLVAVHTDAGISGSDGLDERDGLADALAMIPRQADGLVIYRLHRLSRQLVLQEQLLAEVWRAGGEIYSTAGGEANLRDDPDDPSRALIRQVMGAVAQYERSMIALRLRRGRRRKAEQGGFAYGAPHYGMRAEGKELVEDPAEQATLNRIAERRREGASLRGITEQLNSEGLKPKRGRRWHPTTVRRVVARLEAERS